MATVDIKVPSPGESISEVRIAQWLVKSGDTVEKDLVIAEIVSVKATLELSAVGLPSPCRCSSAAPRRV